MIDRSSYCFDIHHTLSLKFYNGTIEVGPCCLATHVPLTTDNTVSELWNDPFLVGLRSANFKQQLTSACDMCKQLEDNGADSRRTQHLKFYSDVELNRPGIRMLDIHLPNLCNLRCTICGPQDSSSWIADAERLGRTIPIKYRYNKQINYDVTGLQIPNTIETIKFWGGEPLLAELHADFLEKADEQGLLKNIRVIYNTNATTRVSDRVLELWSRARLVELYFSIDDVGSRSDYQRFGSTWSELTENIKWFSEHMPHNHLFYVMCSVGALNIYNLPEVVAWKKANFDQNRYGDEVKLLFNVVQGPCAINKAAPDFYQQLQQRFADYPELTFLLSLITVEDGYCPTEFLNYVHQLDQIRGTNFNQLFLEYDTA